MMAEMEMNPSEKSTTKKEYSDNHHPPSLPAIEGSDT